MFLSSMRPSARLVGALAFLSACAASQAAMPPANFNYTLLPSSYHNVALGVAFSLENDGTIMYEAASNGQVGFAVIGSNGTFFRGLGTNEGAQSMNLNQWIVANGPCGASVIHDGDGKHAFTLNGCPVFLWGINNENNVVGYQGNSGFIYGLGNHHLYWINYPCASETMVRGLSNNNILCGSYWDGCTHGFVKDSSWHSVNVPGADVTVCSRVNNYCSVLGYYEGACCRPYVSRGGFILQGGKLYDIQLPPPPTYVTNGKLSDYWVLPLSINDRGLFVVARISNYDSTCGGDGFTRYVSFLAVPCATRP